MAMTLGTSLPVPQYTECVAAQFTPGTSGAALDSTSLGSAGFAILQADATNTGTVYLGDSGGQYISLSAGAFLPGIVPLDNLTRMFAKGSASGQKLNAIIFK